MTTFVGGLNFSKLNLKPDAEKCWLKFSLVHLSENILNFFSRDPNDRTKELPNWSPVCSSKIEFLHVKDEFRMRKGWTEGPSYAFYHSLPLRWRKIRTILPDTCV